MPALTSTERSEPQLYVPDELAPVDGEAAVLSTLAVGVDSQRQVVAGSLLTVPVAVAYTSTRRWGQLQPETTRLEDGIDLGPIFCAEPFAGVRIARSIVDISEWRLTVDELAQGNVLSRNCPNTITITGSSSTVLIAREGIGAAHYVTAGAERPVLGVAASLEVPAMPPTEAIWELPAPPHLPRGPALGSIYSHRSLVNWTEALVGISWPAGGDVEPPACFVIGRIQSKAWIAKVRPHEDTDQLVVSIAWDERTIDPLSCSILTRAEQDGYPIFVRSQRISEFPWTPAKEPRQISWGRRTLNVTLPRGPRSVPWGLMLLGPDGRLLDERAVGPRLEQINFAFHVDGLPAPASTSTVGDRRAAARHVEHDQAVRGAAEEDEEARRAASERRISTAGELAEYLRWRFSARDGELLLLDAGLFSQGGRESEVAEFLAGFDRPVRALVGGLHQSAHAKR
jgi:hypothetical protein